MSKLQAVTTALTVLLATGPTAFAGSFSPNTAPPGTATELQAFTSTVFKTDTDVAWLAFDGTDMTLEELYFEVYLEDSVCDVTVSLYEYGAGVGVHDSAVTSQTLLATDTWVDASLGFLVSQGQLLWDLDDVSISSGQSYAVHISSVCDDFIFLGVNLGPSPPMGFMVYAASGAVSVHEGGVGLASGYTGGLSIAGTPTSGGGTTSGSVPALPPAGLLVLGGMLCATGMGSVSRRRD